MVALVVFLTGTYVGAKWPEIRKYIRSRNSRKQKRK